MRVAVREGGFPSVFVRLSHGRTVCPRYRSPTFSVNAMVISVAVWRLWCTVRGVMTRRANGAE